MTSLQSELWYVKYLPATLFVFIVVGLDISDERILKVIFISYNFEKFAFNIYNKVKNENTSLKAIPFEIINKDNTFKICKTAVATNVHEIYYLPRELLSSDQINDILLTAILNDTEILGDIIRLFPNVITREFCLNAVKTWGRSLKYVPDEFVDKEMVIAAFKQDYWSIFLASKKYELVLGKEFLAEFNPLTSFGK